MFFLSASKIKPAVEFHISLTFDVPLYIIIISVFSFKNHYMSLICFCISQNNLMPNLWSEAWKAEVCQTWCMSTDH